MSKTPTDNLCSARRRLEEISEVQMIKDWTWDEITSKFYICISIDLGAPCRNIPRVTEWYIVASEEYPFGLLGVYPSIQNSLTDTFFHQSNNAFIEKNGLWRKGKLCVDYIDQSLGIHAFEEEPFNVDERLYWNVHRAILWLRCAEENRLIQDGDFFELPDFCVAPSANSFVFQEDIVSKLIWEECKEKFGLAKVSYNKSRGTMPPWIVQSFLSLDGKQTVFKPIWGTLFSDIEENYEDRKALWIMLDEPPTINIWQPPTVLAELIGICKKSDIDLIDTIRQFAHYARDGKQHLLLVGFPIPKRIGEASCEIYWQAIQLPVLSYQNYTNRNFQSGKKGTALIRGVEKGYRPGEQGWWMSDRKNILLDDMKLDWQYSENYASRTIKGRGKLSQNLTSKRIAVIGVGSLGASIAELLARAGVTSITCIDGDTITIGNLCRHTLCMDNLYQPKSKSVATRLASIDPNISSKAICKYLQRDNRGAISPDLSDYDIVIETTGENSVLAILENEFWKRKKVICTASVGLGGKHSYINIQETFSPSYEAFFLQIERYLSLDKAAVAPDDLPRDGIGCWHPLFPARSDNMWLAACNTVNTLESFLQDSEHEKMTAVFEMKYDNHLYTGTYLTEVGYE